MLIQCYGTLHRMWYAARQTFHIIEILEYNRECLHSLSFILQHNNVDWIYFVARLWLSLAVAFEEKLIQETADTWIICWSSARQLPTM